MLLRVTPSLVTLNVHDTWSKETEGHMGLLLDDSASVSVSSMEIVTQVVDQREKVRPAGGSFCRSERKFALHVQNG